MEAINPPQKKKWFKMKTIIFILIFSIILSIIFCLLTFLFIKISHYISWLGALIIYIFGLYWLVFKVCQLAVFPGSFWMWRRYMERSRSMYIYIILDPFAIIY